MNREITALICLLNHAAKEPGLLENCGDKKAEGLGRRLRPRTCFDGDEYAALLDASPRWLFAEKLGWKNVDVLFPQELRTADQSAK